MDLQTGRVSSPVDIPLPFNVVGLSMEAPGVLLLADAGVHPNGFGRLMRSRLSDGNLDIIAGGWSGVGSLAYLSSRRLALLSHVGPWPRGSVFALDADAPTGPPRLSWEGLNRPSQFSVSSDEKEVLISTGDGIVDLRLG
jgi:hypothetical protein